MSNLSVQLQISTQVAAAQEVPAPLFRRLAASVQVNESHVGVAEQHVALLHTLSWFQPYESVLVDILLEI